MFNQHYTRQGLLRQYPGLDKKHSRRVHKILREDLDDENPPPSKSTVQRVTAVYAAARVEPYLAERLATAAVRMEANAWSSIGKTSAYSEEEQRRAKRFRYKVRDGDDFRTTKMSRWIQSQIPKEGLPLDALDAVFDRAVELAKRGAFREDGELGHVPGNPNALPPWFKRRGYQVHYIDPREELYNVEERHTLVRVI